MTMTAAAIVASIVASAAAASATVVSASASAVAAVASASVTESWGPLVGWLEETSVQAGLLVLLILAVRAILRDRLAPRWRYSLWLVLVVRLALPWAPQSGWSVYNLVPKGLGSSVDPERAGGPFAVPSADGRLSDASSTGRAGAGAEAGRGLVVPASAGPRTRNGATGNATVEGGPAEAGTTSPGAASLSADARAAEGAMMGADGPSQGLRALRLFVWRLVGWRLLLWAPVVWLAGALALLAVVLAQSAALARAIRRRPALADWTTMDLLAECRATMGIRPWLLVYETPHVRTPALFGVWRPRLLLPEGAVAALGPERLRHVFLHELAHLRRRDVAMNWVVTVLQICHWFNPLVWIAFHRMRADRELACDALVLSRVRPEEVPEYGRTIIYLMEAFSFPDSNRLPSRLSRSASLAGILEDRGEARRRIGMIARFKQGPRRWSILAGALLLAFAFVALTNARKAGPAGGNASSAPGGLYFEAATGQLWDLPSLPDQDPLVLPPGEVYLSGTERRVVRNGDAYVFEYRAEVHDYRPTTATTHVWTATFAAKPSATATGDLDEVAVYAPLIWSEDGKVASLESRPQDGDGHPNPAHPLKHPLVSFLHRVSDPRVREYIRLSAALEHDAEAQMKKDSPTNWATVRDSADAMALQEVARQMADAAPRDAFLRVLYMKALVVRHDAAGLRRELEASRPRLAKTRVLGPHLWELTETLRAYDLTDAGRNGYDLLLSLYDREAAGGLPARLARLPEVLRYDDYAQPLHPFDNWGVNFLQLQTSAKIFMTAADLSFLGGDRQRALETSVSVYRAGQLMSQNGTLLNRMIGTAVRSIAVRGLASSVLDGCERPEEVRAAFQRLEWLNQRERPKGQEDLVGLERLSYMDGMGETDLNLSEAESRVTFADARFQLVRMGASAWYVRLKTGQFPKAAGQFELLPGGTPPRDPFADGDAPLRFVERPDALVCYSLGPDKEDNGGAITYNPTNGTKSAGDITLEVPRERKYPFPAGGVKARDKADLLRQFPNGLPTDIFAPWTKDGKASLGVTDTSPVYVYSRGPDQISAADEGSRERRDGKPILPLLTYDPTNGTTSNGDIWLAVPTPGPAAVRVGAPR
jgi:bla regulator protein BlaR1